MILVFLIGLALLEISLIGFLLWKMHELVAQRKSTHGEIQRAESALRDEFSRNRDEGANRFHELRQEVATALLTTHHAVTQTLSDLPVAQQNQFELFGKRLSDFIRSSDQKLDALRSALESSLNTLIQSNEQKQETLRSTLEAQLNRLRQENDAKLEQMRQTVDEKLQGALEKRLGESFNLVAERLELVHKGLGEMQNLATGVGDLKKVLSNIRARGTCGEVQLEMLLEQMLSPQQYARNVLVRDDSGERVEFAVRLPGRGEAGEVLLPIDAKFPQEDYQRLVEAQERADTDGIAHCTSKLEDQIKRCARDVYEKYINPPRTTDFAILFVPTEGLFAEIIRRPGLIESLQQQYHVTVAGPTTLAALLCSLQMGFRTFAIEQRAGEVWKLLGEVKTEFLKFGGILDKVRRKLTEASNRMDDVSRRTRAITRRLRDVEVLPEAGTPATEKSDLGEGTEVVAQLEGSVESEPSAISNVAERV